MLETKIKLIEDRPDRVTVSQSPRPWRWGGFDVSLAQLFVILIFLGVSVIKGSRRLTVDRVYQNVTIVDRTLFSKKRRQFPFPDIATILLQPRRITRVAGSSSPTSGAAAVPIVLDLGDLYLRFTSGDNIQLITGYWDSRELNNVADKISSISGKPVIYNTSPGNPGKVS